MRKFVIVGSIIASFALSGVVFAASYWELSRKMNEIAYLLDNDETSDQGCELFKEFQKGRDLSIRSRASSIDVFSRGNLLATQENEKSIIHFCARTLTAHGIVPNREEAQKAAYNVEEIFYRR